MTAPARDEVIQMAREAGIEVHPRKDEIRLGKDALIGVDSTEKVERLVAAAYARGVADARDSAPADHIPDARKMVPDLIEWECTVIGLKRLLTQAQYEAQTPAVKRFYVPFRCSTCAAQALVDQQATQALATNGGAK